MSPTCYGCLLQPNFNLPIATTTPCHSEFYDSRTENNKGLTYQEKEVLDDLKKAWDKFAALGDHISHDLTEFSYAIHLAQQKLAVRVARRIDTDVWRQPEVNNEG
jgi:hypothetical protein